MVIYKVQRSRPRLTKKFKFTWGDMVSEHAS